MLNTANYLAAAAVIGTVFGFVVRGWSALRTGLARVVGVVFTSVEVHDEETGRAVLNFLIERYQRSRLFVRTFGGKYELLRDGKYALVPFEYFGGKSLLFWNGWRPILFCLQKPKQEGKETKVWWSFGQKEPDKLILVFLRGTFDPEAIVREASAARNRLTWSTDSASSRKRFFIKHIPDATAGDEGHGKYSAGTGMAWYYEGVYRLLAHDPSNLGQAQPTAERPLDALLFPDRILALIHEIKIWRNNRTWYRSRNIPWKRGWCLFGPPGTGKTHLVRATAEELDMPLFVYSLGELMNGELQRSWRDMQAHAPCIALLEDLDNVFHGRENVYRRNPLAALTLTQNQNQNQNPATETAKHGMLSFDCLLNCIDGVDKSEGVFTVITTNDVTKLDWALGQPRTLPDGSMEFISTRPGRIDQAIHLGFMERREKVRMAERILGDYPEGLRLLLDFLDRHPGLEETPSQWQERCSQVALSFFWEEQTGLRGSGEVARASALRAPHSLRHRHDTPYPVRNGHEQSA